MPARRAAERLRIVRVEHVEHEVGVGVVVDELEVVGRELRADRPHPRLVRRRRRRSPDRVLPHGGSLPSRRLSAASGQEKRSRSRGITRSPPRPSPATSTPRTIAAGTPSPCPSRARLRRRSRPRRRSSSSAARSRARPASRGGRASATMPGDAERDIGRALPPGAAERVAHDHAGCDARSARARRSRSRRPRRRDRPAAG